MVELPNDESLVVRPSCLEGLGFHWSIPGCDITKNIDRRVYAAQICQVYNRLELYLREILSPKINNSCRVTNLHISGHQIRTNFQTRKR